MKKPINKSVNVGEKSSGASPFLTARKRIAIRNRNSGNSDVLALLADGDALRRVLNNFDKSNESLVLLLDQARSRIKQLERRLEKYEQP